MDPKQETKTEKSILAELRDGAFKEACRVAARTETPEMTDEQFEENWKASLAVLGI